MKFAIITAIILCPIFSFAQLHTSFHVGQGSNQMKEMKTLQQEFANDFPVAPKTVSSFPAYYFYEGTIAGGFLDRFFAGVSIARGSTGGRIQYSDYSGSVKGDQILKYWSVGFPFTAIINPKNKSIQFSAGIRPSFVFTDLSLDFESKLGDDVSFRSGADVLSGATGGSVLDPDVLPRHVPSAWSPTGMG